jgi:hypothetical protein
VVPLAPRYDPRLIEAILELDDRDEPIAETCRRVGERAWELALPRPTYPHLWRLVRAKRDYEDAERERREALRAIAGDAATRLMVGRFVDAYDVAERVREVQSRYS